MIYHLFLSLRSKNAENCPKEIHNVVKISRKKAWRVPTDAETASLGSMDLTIAKLGAVFGRSTLFGEGVVLPAAGDEGGWVVFLKTDAKLDVLERRLTQLGYSEPTVEQTVFFFIYFEILFGNCAKCRELSIY